MQCIDYIAWSSHQFVLNFFFSFSFCFIFIIVVCTFYHFFELFCFFFFYFTLCFILFSSLFILMPIFVFNTFFFFGLFLSFSVVPSFSAFLFPFQFFKLKTKYIQWTFMRSFWLRFIFCRCSKLKYTIIAKFCMPNICKLMHTITFPVCISICAKFCVWCVCITSD